MEWPQCFLKKCTKWIQWEHVQVEKDLRKQGPNMVWVSPSLNPQEVVQVLWKDMITLHLCVHACVCVYHVYVLMCMCAYVCMYECLWMYSCMCELCFVFVNCKCLCVWCVCRCVFMHVHVHICAWVYLCMHVCEACIMGVCICLCHLLIHELSEAWEWRLLLLISRKVPSSTHTCNACWLVNASAIIEVVHA